MLIRKYYSCISGKNFNSPGMNSTFYVDPKVMVGVIITSDSGAFGMVISKGKLGIPTVSNPVFSSNLTSCIL